RILRQGGDLRVLWGSAWTPPMTACPAIISPRVAFVSVAQPVTNVQFVQLRACWNPVPTAGRADPDLHTLLPNAPDYIITFKAGVDGTSEIARLQAVYGIAAMAASTRGFAANLPPAVLAQMRCESAIKYIDHVRAATGG
ncbi:MAG TPA: hypothetical protein VN649_14360, partial [Ramlibacter sp.]|nr:hypothetical protein [Ramlibacter sp.]